MWKKLNVESYKVMEQYHKNGKIKKIGVSNFEIKHLKNIIKKCDIVPYVNQIEMHPGLNNIRLIKFCKKHNIKVEAYAPLGHGELMQDPLLIKLAKKYKVSVAQICIR
jgi:diketogulonate reductase-like aldo/keto reductase